MLRRMSVFSLVFAFMLTLLYGCGGGGSSDPTKVVTPVMSPEAGTYSSNQEVIITSKTAGADIYYTTDGTTPTASSTLYSGAVPVTGDGTEMTIKAIAIKTGLTNSEVASEDYVIDYSKLPELTATPTSKTSSVDLEVALSSSVAGVTIYYTTNGTTPDTTSNVYTAPIGIEGDGTTMTIKAFSVKAEMKNSDVISEDYEIDYSKVSSITADPEAGAYNVNQEVELTTTTTGTTIYYTTDGSEPSSSSTLYTDLIPVLCNGGTIKAIATKNMMKDSDILEAEYAMSCPSLSPFDTITTSINPVAAKFNNIFYDTNAFYAVGYITGSGTYNFGNGITVAGGATGSYKNAVIVKYNTEGIAQWAKSTVEAYNDSEFNDVVAVGGAVAAVGYIEGDAMIDFGGESGAIAGPVDAKNPVVVLYEIDGDITGPLTTTAQPDGDAEFKAIAANATDTEAFLVGYATGAGDFTIGSPAGTATGTTVYSGSNAVLAIINRTTGQGLKVKTFSTAPDSSKFHGVYVASSDAHIYVVGEMQGNNQFSMDSIDLTGPAADNPNPVILSIDNDGTYNLFAGKTGYSGSTAIFYDVYHKEAASEVYVVGLISGVAEYNFNDDITPVTAQGAYIGDNAVFVRYTSGLTAEFAKTTDIAPAIGVSYFTKLTTDGTYIYATGAIADDGEYGFEDDVTVQSTDTAVYHPLIVKYNPSSPGTTIKGYTIVSSTELSTVEPTGIATDGTYLWTTLNLGQNATTDFGYGVTATTPNIANTPYIVRHIK